MASVEQRTLTAEEFWRLPGDGKRRELVRGEVVEEMPPGGKHGMVASEMSFRLRTWSRSGAGGVVGVESGFVLSRGPDVVRGPEVSYVRAERVPAGRVPEAFWELAPDLVVEVVSPGESADAVREKVRDYLDAGTPLVWLVYPRTREVVVHTPDGLARSHDTGDTLEGYDLLPGFGLPVAELFG